MPRVPRVWWGQVRSETPGFLIWEMEVVGASHCGVEGARARAPRSVRLRVPGIPPSVLLAGWSQDAGHHTSNINRRAASERQAPVGCAGKSLLLAGSLRASKETRPVASTSEGCPAVIMSVQSLGFQSHRPRDGSAQSGLECAPGGGVVLPGTGEKNSDMYTGCLGDSSCIPLW